MGALSPLQGGENLSKSRQNWWDGCGTDERERERERGGGGGGGATMRVSKEVKESSILGDGNRICIKN